MNQFAQTVRSARRLLATAALLSTVATGAAFAGSCPADKAVADGKGQPMAAFPARGVTDDVIATNDITKPPVGINDRLFRLRRLVVQPGGVVPWHSHGDRPALIYIMSGEIYEHASNCAVPILHKAGEVARETHATAHWWKNEGKALVVLLSFDIQHDPNDHNM